MSSSVICVEHLSKRYRLGILNSRTLVHDLQSRWARWRGRDDPNTKVHTAKRRNKTNKRLSTYGNDFVWALRDVSFEIQQGETLGVIGRNGAGKSTLLKILSRVTAPSSGEVKIRGRVASLLEIGTGFHPELTGRENVYLNGTILGMSRKEINRKFDEIIAFSGIDTHIDTPVKRYSSGMYVRLAFAVAAHLDPEILVVDEVLAVGDAAFQKKCLSKMGDVAREGKTVIFVSHNMGAITNLCRRAIHLDDGSIIVDAIAHVAVNHYLSIANQDEQGEILFENASGDSYFTRIASLDNNNKVTSSFSVLNDIILVFDYSVIKNIPGVDLTFAIYDRNGSKLFTSSLLQSGFDSILEEHAPGKYRANVHIPAGLLTPGTYFIGAGLHRPNQEVFDFRDNTLRFEIIETGSPFYKYGGKDIGSFFVHFVWEHTVA